MPYSHPPAESIRTKVLSELKLLMQQEQYETWFRGFSVAESDDRAIEFVAPNGFMRDWIAKHFMPCVRQAVEKAIGSPMDVRIGVAEAAAPADRAADGATVDPAQAQPNGPPARSELPIGTDVQRVVENIQESIYDAPHAPPGAGKPAGSLPSGAAATPNYAFDLVQPRSELNRHYTFEQFVVGRCNRLAHAAAMAIGANPGQAYNPFFVHGNVGLGKTHLLQAIAHALKQMHQDCRVVYLSCEEFTNRFIEAAQNQQLEAFRAFYRSADILVIDDVEFLARTTRTQVEFFHTFNALYNSHRQIILSSDRPAPEIPTLEDRLVSRFRWGLEAQIEAPCVATRAAIVKRKAFLRGSSVEDEVADFIAKSVTSNVRELEGALIKVLGLATVERRPADLALAKQALKSTPGRRPVVVTLPAILKLITEEFSVTAKEILGKARTQAVSLPRQIGMFLAREHTEHSLEEVGRFFGKRDHTTVLYAVAKIKERCAKDHAFQSQVEQLGEHLTQVARDDS